MALRLTLKPGERVIVGEALLRNGSRRAHLVVENEVPILRESDILLPQAVASPAERVYLALELAYVDPKRRPAHLATFRGLADELIAAAPSLRPLVAEIRARVAAETFYRALKSAHVLLQRERGLLRRCTGTPSRLTSRAAR